jgi:hypothetical protein
MRRAQKMGDASVVLLSFFRFVFLFSSLPPQHPSTQRRRHTQPNTAATTTPRRHHNRSYGEPVVDALHGRIAHCVRELVRRHGVIFCTSAGNAGPALGTVGAPAGPCFSDVISVGAYVSPHMSQAQ